MHKVGRVLNIAETLNDTPCRPATDMRHQLLRLRCATGWNWLFGCARMARNGGEIHETCWFSCAVLDQQPRLALTVLVEHGEAGSTTAANMAKHILEAFYAVPG